MSLCEFIFKLTGFLPLARAGGGDLFGDGGGGGGDGGGGGSSGDGDATELIFYGLRMLIWLHTKHLPSALVVDGILIIGGAIYYHRRHNKSGQFNLERKHSMPVRRPQKTHSPTSGSTIQPDNESSRLIARVPILFNRIQEAWTAGDPGRVRALISAGVYERFVTLLAMNHARGVRNETTAIQIAGITPTGREHSTGTEVLHLTISAGAQDRYYNIKTGKLIHDASGPFTEQWTFIRGKNCETSPAGGLLEGHCPGCGAALQHLDLVICEYCGVQVNSPLHDWLLVEITQARFEAHSRQVAGLDQMIAMDPAFMIQDVEDRASALFWRLMHADVCGDFDILSPVATGRLTRELANASGARSTCFTDVAVGTVSASAVSVAPGPSGHDEITIDVRWTGRPTLRANLRADGVKPESSRSYCTVMTLFRDVSARGNNSKKFVMHICPQCGAPFREGTRDKCLHCETALNDGRYSWTMGAVTHTQGRQSVPA